MIPKNIKREHILQAIEEIEKVGAPKGRSSKKFLLKYNDKQYSPKYVISLANKYANGKELDPTEFSGGKESNDFLKYLGFNIVEIQSSHDERCPRCKETIKAMLENIYGKIETNSKFEIGVYPKDFRSLSHYNNLKEIYKALQNHRGFKEFVKAKTLPNCDFFVPNPGFIVEFDESQHFTLPRKIALGHYPEKLELGFDRKKWIELCERISAKDNDPPYRDEQRAWYDTLRDFLPTTKGLKPTIRLYAKDSIWCGLYPNNPSDFERFKSLLKGEYQRWKIEVREESNPFAARIITANKCWEGNREEAKKLLKDVCKNWPKGKKVKFLITSGGFILFDWPQSIGNIGDNKFPNKKAVDTLIEEAEKCARYVLNHGFDKKLRECTNYITLGIDSYEGISTMSQVLDQDNLPQPHIELVCLIDLRNKNFYWTGKSYPTPDQEDGLVRISDLKTHFLGLEDVGKILILGCHDLTVFNPMSLLNPNMSRWRKKVNNEFRKMAKKQKPIYILQHPHTTVKRRTWLNAWNGLRKILRSSVEQYFGAGRYCEPYRNRSEWDALDDVLKNTKHGNTIDFIVWMSNK